MIIVYIVHYSAIFFWKVELFGVILLCIKFFKTQRLGSVSKSCKVFGAKKNPGTEISPNEENIS